MTFRPLEWHHGYLGLALILLALLPPLWLVIPGAVLVADDLVEHVTGFGALLWVYGKTLYRIPAVRRLNEALDALFGKRSLP